MTPEALDALLAEMGTNGQLSKDDLKMIVGKKKREKTGVLPSRSRAPAR